MDNNVIISVLVYGNNQIKFGCCDTKGGKLNGLTEHERGEIRYCLQLALQAKLVEIDG